MYVTCGIYALSLHSALLQIPVNVRQARRSAPGALQSAVGGWSRVVRAQGTPPPQATHTEVDRTPQKTVEHKTKTAFSQNIALCSRLSHFGIFTEFIYSKSCAAGCSTVWRKP